jgi:1,2-diacylglycerol 3-alpha-glucosyltransferase
MGEAQFQVRVLFSCSGVGILNRGIESFFREGFDGLKLTEGIDARLLKGAGDAKPDETVVWNLPRTGRFAKWLGYLTRRNGYVAEQWSTFLPVIHQIRCFRPHVVFYSDSNLGFLLYRFRKQIGVPFRLLFSNGGPCHPPFMRTDFVHQVAPFYHEEALRSGEPPAKHFMVPYGITIPPAPVSNLKRKRELRFKLGLPLDSPVVLSVGWIARRHKRMDYVVEEVSRMPQPRPFLLMLGAMDEASKEIIEIGESSLGRDGFSVRSVPYHEIADYYRAADCFVLASLKEGFGRVYLEALMHGLPVIAHRHPVMEFVVGDAGILADLSTPGVLALVLTETLATPITETLAHERWERVRDRFGWEALRVRYLAMFQGAAYSKGAA